MKETGFQDIELGKRLKKQSSLSVWPLLEDSSAASSILSIQFLAWGCFRGFRVLYICSILGVYGPELPVGQRREAYALLL